MAKYEVVLVKYPNLDHPDNLWWTAVCLAMRGCVSDGQTREEALMMIADAMALYLEEEPGSASSSDPRSGANGIREESLALGVPREGRGYRIPLD